MSPERRDRRGGFVLIEALATLALSALVLAGAASLVALVLHSADRTAMSVEHIETTDKAIDALARDIRAAARVHRQADAAPSLVFLGSSSEIMIVQDRRGDNGLSRPAVVHWASEATDAGRGRLTRSEAPLLPGQPTPAPGSGERVAVDTGTAVIRFAYFGAAPNGGGEVLTDEWTTPETMPVAVRIGAADPDTLAVTRSVRVAISTTAELGCVNPALGYCSLTPNRKEPEPGQNGEANAPEASGREQRHGHGSGSRS